MINKKKLCDLCQRIEQKNKNKKNIINRIKIIIKTSNKISSKVLNLRTGSLLISAVKMKQTCCIDEMKTVSSLIWHRYGGFRGRVG